MKPRPANEPLFTFKIIDPECSFRVMEFSAREWISAPYEVNLTLAKKKEVKFSDAIGKEALLKIAGEENRFFHGILSQFVKTGKKGAFYLYKATLVPDLWRLSLKQDCRIFQNMDTPAIVKDVLDKADITSVDVSNLTKYGKREYCVQYRETDLNFFSRLLAEVGIFYFFEHKNDDHKLIFGDSDSHYKDITGDTKVTFIQDPGKETVSTFVVSQHIHSDKVTLRDFRFRDPTNPLSKADPDSEKDWERYDYPGGYCVHDTKKPDGSPKEDAADYDEIILEDKTDGAAHKNFAKIRQEEVEMFKERAEGQSNCPRFTPGFVFELTDHDLEDFDKEYVLLEVVHTGSQPQVLEAVAVRYEDATYSNQFLCIPDTLTFRPLGYTHGLTGITPSETFRPLKETPKPVVKGPQTAIVVKNDKKDGTTPKSPPTDDENVFTDKYGRVKVRFHWERPHDQAGSDEWYHSAWIRVSQAWAGQGWGAMHIPHVGQEVIVDFLEGDPDRPIITGRVYNQANMPHNANDDVRNTMNPSVNKHVSGFRDEYGNKLIFDATSGQESVLLKSPKNNSSLSLGEAGAEMRTDADFGHRVQGHMFEAGAGTKFEALFGLGIDFKLAQAYEIAIGSVFELFAGQKVEIGFGTEYELKLTKDLKSVQADIEHKCNKDYKLEAGDGFSILGGTKDKSPNQSVINAFADGIMLSLGPEAGLKTAEKDHLKTATWGLFGAASILGIAAAIAAKIASAATEGTAEEEPTWADTTFGSATAVIAAMQAIIATYIGAKSQDSVEPSYHEEPLAVFGINTEGITFAIKPDLEETKTKLENIRGDLKLFSRKLGLLADGLNFKKAYQRKKEVDKLKENEREIWKDFIKKSMGEKTDADSKIMMKKDGSIIMNSQGDGKEFNLFVGEKDNEDAQIQMKEHGIGLMAGETSISILKDSTLDLETKGKTITLNPGTGNVEIKGSKVTILGSEFSKTNVTILKNLSVS